MSSQLIAHSEGGRSLVPRKGTCCCSPGKDRAPHVAPGLPGTPIAPVRPCGPLGPTPSGPWRPLGPGRPTVRGFRRRLWTLSRIVSRFSMPSSILPLALAMTREGQKERKSCAGGVLGGKRRRVGGRQPVGPLQGQAVTHEGWREGGKQTLRTGCSPYREPSPDDRHHVPWEG